MISSNQLVDQLGQRIELPEHPKRIVSLVPSQTELLAHYGMDQQVVGITKFCVHPEAWFRSKKRIGGTKNFKIDQIKNLEPDLVIANKEENTREGIELLQQFVPVYVSDISHLAAAEKMVKDLASLSKHPEQGIRLWEAIDNSFTIYRKEKKMNPLKVAYLIWWNPMITVGEDTFIHSMLNECGFENVFANRKRYPQVTMEALKAAAPDLILLSSEPFPFKEKHQKALQAQLPASRPLLVDGEVFSWYGSRLLKAVPYFRSLWDQINS